jgi:hypothetical protein
MEYVVEKLGPRDKHLQWYYFKTKNEASIKAQELINSGFGVAIDVLTKYGQRPLFYRPHMKTKITKFVKPFGKLKVNKAVFSSNRLVNKILR